VDRRTFLAMGVAALGLAGCTTDTPPSPTPTSPSIPTGPEDPDATLRASVARSEAELIVAYRIAISSRPELASDLQPFLDHHQQHLDRVLPGADPQALAKPTTGAWQSPAAAGGSATGPSPSVTDQDPEAIAALAAAEREARNARVSACDGASAPGLARDLCLIAASEAQHAAALDALAEAVAER
jgi:hypothetical protein